MSDVIPVLEGRCASTVCHGVAPDAEAKGETIDWSVLNIRVDAEGRVADVEAAYRIVKSRINTIERSDLSSLLRKPLAPERSGVHHMGGAIFASRDEPAYLALRGWIEAEDGGGEGGRIDDLPANQRMFAEDVLPRLAARQCMNGPCHGPAAPFTAFEPPLEIDGDLVFSRDMVRADYAAARMHLFLGGDPLQSRLIRKGLPLGAGGVAHRGGNDIFFNQGSPDDPRSDPDVAAIAAWAEAERGEALGPGGAPKVLGIVFVRGPVPKGSPLDHDSFVPGSDLFIVDAGAPASSARNLTAVAHKDGPADVRDPAVSHDGGRVAFAMRTHAEGAHAIYEIRVDGSGLRRLTSDAAALPTGGRAADVQPTYGPDGRVYFVSTRAGHLDARGERLDTEIWAVEPEGGALTRITHDPSPELTPTFFGVGKSHGTLAFTVVRATPEGDKAVVFREPLDHNKTYHGDPELHIHHGLTAPGSMILGMRATPDGRFTAALLDDGALFGGGALALFDRQFGPDMTQDAASSPSVGGFRRAVTVLDVPPSADGKTVEFVRHPVPLPDGRILASIAEGPGDPSAPGGAPDFDVIALTLAEDRALGGPRVVGREALVAEPGVADYDAEPLVARPLEEEMSHELAWDPSATTGTLAYRHVETLEALMTNLAPSGPKTLRDDLVYARLIESIPTTPADRDAGAISAGHHGRSRILAEVPLLGGSLFLEVPAGAPFRVQTLNADRMAVGAQHRRFLDVAPGQVFPGGVAPSLYPTLCAGCHGSLSGDPSGSLGPVPDAITGPSMTLATHDGLDPRRPRAPIRVGDQTIRVDFRADVLPLLKRSCARGGCHAGPSPAGGLGLEAKPTADFDAAYEALLSPGEGSAGGRRYVDEAGTSARSSYLIERIYGRELDAPRALGGACLGDPALSEEERLTFVRWIDLGAAYRGDGL